MDDTGKKGLAAWRAEVSSWPEPWQERGRRILGDGHLTLAICRHSQMVAVFHDIVKALTVVENEMRAKES